MLSKSITIGLPVYNGAIYVERALTSLLRQTHDDIRIIISDNGSTDGTVDILKHYAELYDNIEVYFQKDNIGIVANFRFVLEKADTEYFMWAAHDDQWDTRYVSECLSVLEGHKNVAVVQATTRLIKEDSDDSSYHIIKFQPNLAYMSHYRLLKYIFSGKYNYFMIGVFRTFVLRPAFLVNPMNVASQERFLLLQIIAAGFGIATTDTTFYLRQISKIDVVEKYKTEEYMRYARQDLYSILNFSMVKIGIEVLDRNIFGKKISLLFYLCAVYSILNFKYLRLLRVYAKYCLQTFLTESQYIKIKSRFSKIK